MENIKKYFGFVIVALIIILAICGCIVTTNNASYALDNESTMISKFEEFTEDKLISVNGQDQSINDYPSYLNSRFQLDNLRYNVKNIEDEWILHIVPIELFRQKQEVLYIGISYGFYFNYDAETNLYLIYLIDNEYNYYDGYLSREIRPLYYEQYVYDEKTEKVSLVYMDYYQLDIHYYHYRKHSRYEKLYLKDVSFSGSLYNINHANIGEAGYDPKIDNGGYFNRTSYKFKGVSSKGDKKVFKNADLKMGMGNISPSMLDVGNVLNAARTLNEFSKNYVYSVEQYNGKVTNENTYEFTNFFNMERDMQIIEFGYPLKHSATSLRTNFDANAVLLGINDNNYVRSEYKINFKNQDVRWNTKYVGKVSLNIVKAKGSQFTEITKNISSINNSGYTINCGEKTEVREYEKINLYVLGDAKHEISFTAPEKGVYTIKTNGNVENSIISNSGIVTAVDNNAALIVSLEERKIFEFQVLNKENVGSANIELEVQFTPEEITKGESKTMEISPGNTEFYQYNSLEVNAFQYLTNTGGNVNITIRYLKTSNEKYRLSGVNVFGAMIAEVGRYYIGIRNDSAINQSVNLVIDDIDSLSLNEPQELNVMYQYITTITLPYALSIKFQLNTENFMQMRIYDEQNNLINSTMNSDEKVLFSRLLAEKKYYIVIEHNEYQNKSASLVATWERTYIKAGDNKMRHLKKYEVLVYNRPDLSGKFEIQSTVDFTLYDSNYNLVHKNADGYYALNGGDYYFKFLEETLELEISIQVVYSETTKGVFDEQGVKYIKVIPQITNNFIVEGIADYTWYDEHYHDNIYSLNEGETYYLQIKGMPLQNYDINLSIRRGKLAVNRVSTIYTGFYYFTIEEASMYAIRTYCSNNVNSTVTIKDESNDVLVNESGVRCEKISVDKIAYDIYLPQGKYYIDIEANTDDIRVGLHIKKV